MSVGFFDRRLKINSLCCKKNYFNYFNPDERWWNLWGEFILVELKRLWDINSCLEKILQIFEHSCVYNNLIYKYTRGWRATLQRFAVLNHFIEIIIALSTVQDSPEVTISFSSLINTMLCFGHLPLSVLSELDNASIRLFHTVVCFVVVFVFVKLMYCFFLDSVIIVQSFLVYLFRFFVK